MSTDPSALPPLPKNHLDHPENWVTGSEPLTSNQEGFIKVLEKQHPDLVPKEGLDTAAMTKSGGSEVIEKLKSGEKVVNPDPAESGSNGTAFGAKKEEASSEEGSAAEASAEPTSKPSKRKSITTDHKDGKTSSADTADPSSLFEAKDSEANDTGKDTKPTKQSTLDFAPADAPPAKKAKVETTSAEANGSSAHTEGGSVEEPIAVDEAGAAKVGKEEGEGSEDVSMGDVQANGHAEQLEVPDMREELTKEMNGHGGQNAARATNGSINGAKTNGHTNTDASDDAKKAEDGSAPADQNAKHTNGVNGVNGHNGEADTRPGDAAHLDHPENWVTGDQPATEKQKGFIKVLEQQKGVIGATGDVEVLGKSEASEKIDELKKM